MFLSANRGPLRRNMRQVDSVSMDVASMSVIANEVRRATYFDSIVLMRISRQIHGMAGVEEAGLMLGTPANKDILREAGVLGPDGEAAEPGDLILALRAADPAAADAAM